jgi:hypothetical protein
MKHPMKALSIRQQWAWLIVSGQKDIENQTWKTNYRGPLLIHAASSFAGMSFEEIEDGYRVKLPPRDKLRRGGIVGDCDLVDCVAKHRRSVRLLRSICTGRLHFQSDGRDGSIQCPAMYLGTGTTLSGNEGGFL